MDKAQEVEWTLMQRQVKAHESIAESLARIAVLLEFPPDLSKDEQHFDGAPYRRVATQ
jgi:hypothetical protein